MNSLNVMAMIFIYDFPLTFPQAALGDEIEVPTVHGKVKLKIPAGTQTGTKFRLKGKGIKNVHGYGLEINM